MAEAQAAAVTDREIKAHQLVKDNVFWAMGAGLLPIPVADVLAQSLVQMKMISEIAQVYEVPFNRESVKALVASLLGGTAAGALTATTGSFIKALPVIGMTAGAVTMSLYGAATTYAVGEVFVEHFRTGGDLLNFDPEKWRGYFNEMVAKGSAMFSNLTKSATAAAGAAAGAASGAVVAASSSKTANKSETKAS